MILIGYGMFAFLSVFAPAFEAIPLVLSFLIQQKAPGECSKLRMRNEAAGRF
jgi:hypothetical protein